MSLRWTALSAALLTAVAIGVASCGSSGAAAGFESDDAGRPADEAGPAGSGGGFGGEAGTLTNCSADLRSVVDGTGAVVATCPPDQGCSAGKCVSACATAEASKSTVGCSYYVAPPDTLTVVGVGACLAAFLVNTWSAPVKLTVERAGKQLDVAAMTRIPSGSGTTLTYAPLPNGEIAPGQVAIVFLSRNGNKLTSCPAGVTPGYTEAPANVAGTGIGEAFHITTSAPVVAYDIFPYGGGNSALTSATLLLPTSSWDTNYVGVNAYRKSVQVPAAKPFLQIVANEDATDVQVLPTADIVGGGPVAASGAGVSVKYTLQKGQMLQLEQPVELTGSVIQSTKPVGVYGGDTCASIDVTVTACDTAHQQLPPVRSLGSRYVAVRYRNRFDGVEESPPWRIVGAVDGTVLTYEPDAPPGAPTSIGLGQVAEFNAPGPSS